ncbi:TnpV protein [Solibaculum intestinale]|uniref:TnpV protein n=1 Tax=Solibaculum intestinale TaxID=3133165 RepID=A0ABV1E147_9FIRM
MLTIFFRRNPESFPKQLSEKEGIKETLKEENQMRWMQKMNNIRNVAMEIVSNELIFC